MAQLALLCGSANVLKLVERSVVSPSVLPNLLVLSILCGRSGPGRRTNHMYDRIRGCTEMLLTLRMCTEWRSLLLLLEHMPRFGNGAHHERRSVHMLFLLLLPLHLMNTEGSVSIWR